jgi:mannose-6-phosphate isomerase-like protein (cupin superfamily)
VSHGESIDVPRGAHHRLGNQGGEELVIVEVQLGGYTGEDDICRYHDDYGRPTD